MISDFLTQENIKNVISQQFLIIKNYLWSEDLCPDKDSGMRIRDLGFGSVPEM